MGSEGEREQISTPSRRRGGCGGRRVHPLGFEGWRPSASRPVVGGQSGPVGLRRGVAHPGLRGLFKSVAMLGELHQGVLAELLTQELGWE